MRYILFVLFCFNLTEKQDIYSMSPITWSRPAEVQVEINFKGVNNEEVYGKKKR